VISPTVPCMRCMPCRMCSNASFRIWSVQQVIIPATVIEYNRKSSNSLFPHQTNSFISFVRYTVVKINIPVFFCDSPLLPSSSSRLVFHSLTSTFSLFLFVLIISNDSISIPSTSVPQEPRNERKTPHSYSIRRKKSSVFPPLQRKRSEQKKNAARSNCVAGP
jgi:hypothetical protein